MTRAYIISSRNDKILSRRRTDTKQCRYLSADNKKDLDYITENLPSLVIKDVSESGGYGVIFGNTLSKNELSAIKEAVKTSPRRFIAQEVIDFKGLKVFENGRQVERKADLRAFVLYGDEIKVWHSGLTRYSQDPDSFVVNSSQGGGFKDTWVLSR